MEKIRKFLVDNQEEIIISGKESKEAIPIFCPVCDFVMASSMDHDYYLKFSCCHNCAMKFATPRKDMWKKGWRPSKEEIDKYRSTIIHQSPSFILD